MKKLSIIIFIMLLSRILLSQSITIGEGAEIYVGIGGDICAGEFGNITGNLIGEGTQCGIPILIIWFHEVSLVDVGGAESSEVLTFGQHPDATDSIDALLGEYELPPPPVAGVFDTRFNLPTSPMVSSLIDYRDSTKTDITWNMTFQPGIYGYPMTFSWDSTNFPEGTFYLRDLIDGNYVFVNMKNQSGYTLTETAVTSLSISHRGLCSMVLIKNRWNMISVPYLAEDMSAGSLFPTATSIAYGYENGYITEDTLAMGKGYWLKFGGDEQIQICGLAMGDTIPVTAGWNMFGVYEDDIPIGQITTIPPDIIASYFFGFNGGYYIADTLKSGGGYWVRVTEGGLLILNSGRLTKEKEQVAKIEQNWGKIQITDNTGNSVTLYASEDKVKSSFYELPPMPPKGIFDVRYSSGKLVEDIRGGKEILISSENYPVTIRAEGISLTVRDIINGDILNQELKNGEELRITNKKIASIEVSGRITGELPISYELYQNYPNPFNPVTTIKFSIPKEVQVNLSIYDILGEKVKDLKNEVMKPGYYEVNLDASQLASGIYFYRIKAGDFVQTKKMVLLH